MSFLKAAQRIWNLYTRLFRVVPISCDVIDAKDTVTVRDGFASIGPDPQLEVLTKKTGMLPGWYRLTYDAHHNDGDALFVPKIYSLSVLEKAADVQLTFPKGYGSKNAVARFHKNKRKQIEQSGAPSAPSKARKTQDRIIGSKDTLTITHADQSVAFSSGDAYAITDSSRLRNPDVPAPRVPVINLLPHLPGQTQHLFRYGFEPKGFRFDPFELDHPKTSQFFVGQFQLNDFRVTFLGVVPFLIFSARQAIFHPDRGGRLRRVQNALQLLKKKGATALMSWLGQKAYLKIQPPFSPTTWYKFFCDPDCFDANRIVRFGDIANLPSFSLFLFLGDSDPQRLSSTVNSVLSQNHPQIQLSILTTSISQPEVIQQANLLAKKYTRIRVVRCEQKEFRQVLDEDESDFICLIESGDQIRPHAVTRLALALFKNRADIAYADEVILTTSGRRVHKVMLRPAFCLDHFLHQPCIGLMTALRRELLIGYEPIRDCTNVETLNERLILDALVSARSIVHIPDIILKRWRSNAASVPCRLPTSAIRRFLTNRGFESATVQTTATPGLYSIRYNHLPPGKTAIIIPTKNHHELLRIAINSLTQTTPKELFDLIVINHGSDEPNSVAYLHEIAKIHRVIDYYGVFNFARINNYAVRQLGEAYDSFLFMNNDVQAIRAGWLESMRDKLGQRQVGVIGAVLLYPPDSVSEKAGVARVTESPDRSQPQIQHAGVHLGVGVAEHYLKTEPYQNAYLDGPSLNPAVPSPITRSFSAVTAACLLVRKELFAKLDGFSEDLAVGFQDVDFCLRAGNEGYKVLCDAEAVLFHHESVSRTRGDFFDRDPHPQDTAEFLDRYLHDIGRDPFYHPMLSTSTTGYRPLRSINQSRLIQTRATNTGLEPFPMESD